MRTGAFGQFGESYGPNVFRRRIAQNENTGPRTLTLTIPSASEPDGTRLVPTADESSAEPSALDVFLNPARLLRIGG